MGKVYWVKFSYICKVPGNNSVYDNGFLHAATVAWWLFMSSKAVVTNSAAVACDCQRAVLFNIVDLHTVLVVYFGAWNIPQLSQYDVRVVILIALQVFMNLYFVHSSTVVVQRHIEPQLTVSILEHWMNCVNFSSLLVWCNNKRFIYCVNFVIRVLFVHCKR